MTELMKIKWQHLTEDDREELLKNIFFAELFDHQQLPRFMTEQDWSDMYKEAGASCISCNENYAVILYFETFAHRYWIPDIDIFWILVRFLKNQLAKVKVGKLNLFQSVSSENLKMWFYFNMEAVFLWMAQHL